MTDYRDLQNTGDGFFSLRYVPLHNIVERSIADFLSDHYLSNVLYITDSCKYFCESK